jgi:phosphatidyl-myo-inositol dimannoside synthase
VSAGRVLFVTSSYPRRAGDHSGAFVHRLAVDVQALGWEVRVLAPHAPGLAADEEIDGVEVHRFRYAWPTRAEALAYGGGMLANLRGRPWTGLTVPTLLAGERLVTARRARHVDLVHAHWVVPQGLALAHVARPMVLSVHGSDVHRVPGGAITTRVQRAVLRSATAVVANSGATAARVEELADRRPDVVPLGVDPEPAIDGGLVLDLRTAYSGRLLVAVVARLVRQKGVDDLLEAIAPLVGVAVLVVGGGPEGPALTALATRLGVAATFTGPVAPEAVASYLAAADVVVAPSRGAEGQGLAVLEAMAVGRAVVATASGGQAESVDDGVTGLVVAPGDRTALTAALARLAGDDALRLRLGEAARADVARRFSRRTAAEATVAVYHKALDQPRRPTNR